MSNTDPRLPSADESHRRLKNSTTKREIAVLSHGHWGGNTSWNHKFATSYDKGEPIGSSSFFFLPGAGGEYAKSGCNEPQHHNLGCVLFRRRDSMRCTWVEKKTKE